MSSESDNTLLELSPIIPGLGPDHQCFEWADTHQYSVPALLSFSLCSVLGLFTAYGDFTWAHSIFSCCSSLTVTPVALHTLSSVHQYEPHTLPREVECVAEKGHEEELRVRNVNLVRKFNPAYYVRVFAEAKCVPIPLISESSKHWLTVSPVRVPSARTGTPFSVHSE